MRGRWPLPFLGRTTGVKRRLTGYRGRVKIAATVLGLLLSVGITHAPAVADPGVPEVPNGSRPGVKPTSKCVTKSEYYSLNFKMSRAEVERILDGSGHSRSRRPGVNTWKARKYRGCDGGIADDGTRRQSTIDIWYRHDRIDDTVWIIFDRG